MRGLKVTWPLNTTVIYSIYSIWQSKNRQGFGQNHQIFHTASRTLNNRFQPNIFEVNFIYLRVSTLGPLPSISMCQVNQMKCILVILSVCTKCFCSRSAKHIRITYFLTVISHGLHMYDRHVSVCQDVSRVQVPKTTPLGRAERAENGLE